jgi:predicted PurR-regulated permease PerM
MGKPEDKIVTFFKSMKWKRISSLLDGFFSGFIFGMAVLALVVSEALREPLTTNVVMSLLVGVILAVAIFVWGVHSALTTKET